MRIPAQTSGHQRVARTLCAAAVTCLWGVPASGAAASGKVRCSVTANQVPATGTIVLEREGREVAGGACGKSIVAPVGSWSATVRLDGALDHPAKTIPVEVKEGQTAHVRVDFETGTLEVRIEAKGGAGTAMVSVHRSSKRIGSLAVGVSAQLSSGTYEVRISLRGEQQRHRPGQRRVIRARF